MKRLILLFVMATAFARGAAAHEMRPAYLELRQTGPETYDVLFKVPGSGDSLRLGLYAELPPTASRSRPCAALSSTMPSPSASA